MAQKEVAFKVVVNTEDVAPELQEVKSQIDELRKANEEMSKKIEAGFKSAEKNAKGFGNSIKGVVKALGLIGVAMAVFEFMRDIVSKNQKIMDALSTATTAFEIVLYKVFDALEPISDAMKAAFENPKQAVVNLWEAIKENLVNRLEGVVLQFEALGSVIKAALDLDWDGVTEGAKDFASATVQVATGLDKVQQAAAVESFKNFVSEVQSGTKAAVDQAKALVNLRNEVKLLEARQRGLILEYQNEAEIQRQIRDDISLTISERLAANEELGRILSEQAEREEAIANKRLELAKSELALNSSSIELQVALIDAETELADVRERINGQRSEQLVNQISLERELADLQKQIRLEGLEAQELEIEEFIQHAEAMNELARLAGEEEIYTQQDIQDQQERIRDKYLKEKLKAERDAAKKSIEISEKERDAKLGAASALANGLGAIVGAIGNQSKASVAIQKTLAIAQIAIDTARSISSAISAATAAAAATGPGAVVATPVFIATQIATVLAAVGQAIAVLNSAPGGGSASLPSVNVSATSAAAPNFDAVTTNTTQLGNTEQAELAPIQAFVVETQLTNTQSEIGQIQSQAEFGGG